MIVSRQSDLANFRVSNKFYHTNGKKVQKVEDIKFFAKLCISSTVTVLSVVSTNDATNMHVGIINLVN